MNSLKLIQHIDSLADISDIMSAMKYLSLMENNKLSRYIQHQKRTLKSIKLAAKDFLQFHPELIESTQTKKQLFVILGSERGFCGSYNETLYQSIDEFLITKENENLDAKIIVVGYKLHHKFEHHPLFYQNLNGPKIAEEIPDIINELIMTINTLKVEQRMNLTVIHHSEGVPQPVFQSVLPAFQSIDTQKTFHSIPPLIHMSKNDLYHSILNEYLFALLNEVFYTAFMSENQYRIRHMDGSIHKLSEKISNLTLKRNEIRQEEITEELEVIMLGSTTLEDTQEN